MSNLADILVGHALHASLKMRNDIPHLLALNRNFVARILRINRNFLRVLLGRVLHLLRQAIFTLGLCVLRCSIIFSRNGQAANFYYE
jgi:hypothetical protein